MEDWLQVIHGLIPALPKGQLFVCEVGGFILLHNSYMYFHIFPTCPDTHKLYFRESLDKLYHIEPTFCNLPFHSTLCFWVYSDWQVILLIIAFYPIMWICNNTYWGMVWLILSYFLNALYPYSFLFFCRNYPYFYLCMQVYKRFLWIDT